MPQKQFSDKVAKTVLAFGIIQAVFGFAYFICCIIFATKSGAVVAPFWSGIPLLLIGVLGIAAGWTKNQCMLIAWLVISIILTILLFVSAAITGIASAILKWAMDIHKTNGASCYNTADDCVCVKPYESPKTIKGMTCDDLDAVHALLLAMTAFGVLGGIACFAASIVACVGLCCYKDQHTTVVVTPGQGQAVVIQNGNVQQQQNAYPPPVYNEKPPIH